MMAEHLIAMRSSLYNVSLWLIGAVSLIHYSVQQTLRARHSYIVNVISLRLLTTSTHQSETSL